MIRFRAIEPCDADLLYEAENEDSVWTDSDTLAPYSRHLLRQYAEGYRADPVAEGQLRLMAVESQTGEPIGILDFYDISFFHSRSFIGVYVFPRHRRQGRATAILRAGADYARKRLGLRILAAKVLATNPASLQLFRRAGYDHSGCLPAWQLTGDTPVDLHLLTLPLP